MLGTIFSKVVWVGRAASALFGLVLMVVLIFGLTSAAFGDDGDFFKLGKSNTASKVTKLIKQGAGPALELRVDSGAPLKVNSDGKVTDLNADQIDGLDSTDLQGKYAQVIVVSKSGGDFTSVQAALDSITDASDDKRYLVWVAPGTYNERVQMKPFIDIEGSGELATKIVASGGESFGAGSSVVSGVSDAELRHLTVQNTGGSTYAMGIFNGSASPRLSNVTATSEGAENNRGVVSSGSSPTMTDVSATATGGASAFGVDNSGDSSPRMTDVTATGEGANYNVGVVNAGSSPTMTDVSATAGGGSFARSIENSSSSPKMTDVTATASEGSTENTGVYNYLHSSPTIRESVISASGTASRGVWGLFPDDTTSLITIENSEVKGATSTIRAEGAYKVNVGASKLDGGGVSVSGTGSQVKCAGVHDENYTFSPSTCP